MLIPYHWPCHVSQDGDGSYRICPVGIAGCDGNGKTQDEAADKAQQALQEFIVSGDQGSLLAMALLQYSDIERVVTGQMIRLEVLLPNSTAGRTVPAGAVDREESWG